MIKRHLIALVFVALIAAGCSSSDGTKTNIKVANALQANSSNTNTFVVGDAGNFVPTPGTIDQVPIVELPEGTNANTVRMNRERKMVDTPGVVPKATSVPAGENSEISSTMDKQGNFVESRLFNGHPQLDKVERTFLDPTNSTIKIYLKGGKVVTASGNKIKDLALASSVAFLELAGIKATPVSKTGTGAKAK